MSFLNRFLPIVLTLAFWTVGVLSPTTAVGQQRFIEWVQMPDGIVLYTEINLPAGAGPFPTVLARMAGYCSGLSLTDYVARGYAGVCQEIRGRGNSGGDFHLWGDDGPDGRVTIEWIAQQTWSNGKVGMVGLSNRAATQYAVAQGAPTALKCLCPERWSPDTYHHMALQGGSLRYEGMWKMISLAGVPSIWEELKLHRLLDSWWDEFDWIGSPETIDVPIFHMGGWYDFAQQGALDGFDIIQRGGGAGAAGNQYLLMDPLTHFGGFGELPVPPPGPYTSFDDYRQQLTYDWLDYWLKDEPTGVESWPAARIYLMGASGEPDAPGNTWIEMPDWPPPGSETRSFYLTQAGGLTETLPQSGQLVLPIDPLDPVRTYGGANLGIAEGPTGATPSGPWDQAAYPVGRPIESRADVLTFTTDVLTHPVTVVGPVTAKIWINPDTPDLDLSVRLTDVYPDGRSILIADGIQRARMRCGDTYECFLTGVPEEVEVDLWSTAMVFNAGHRIRVAVAGTNWDRFEINSNDGGDLNNPNYIAAYPEILFGPQYPSALLLPFPALFADGFESGTTSAWSTVVP